jgi:succinyl-diaminopimelate desuccinylase
VHLGINAIERLMAALMDVFSLRELPVPLPAEVARAIDAAAPVSEAISGKGESNTLRSLTVNCGVFNGGTLRNIMPAEAGATLDLRLPAGLMIRDVEERLVRILARHEGVQFRVGRRFEPLWSDPQHEISGICSGRGAKSWAARR